MRQHSHIPYRSDIDGLRAVAVLSVVIYHVLYTFASTRFFLGGYTGVDIFFVISGYLISSNIMRQLSDDSFSISDFYGRRIRRIFPALAIVLGFCLFFGWFYLLANEYKQVGKNVAGGAAFVSNFVLYSETGYFNVEAIQKPLLHLWSLAIEEQFYVVWPLLLWISHRNISRRRYVLLVLGGASLFACVVWTGFNKTLSFYSPLTRFWELIAGAIVAAARPIHWRGYLPQAVIRQLPGSNNQSLIGAALIAISFVWITPDDRFPGIIGLLPVMGGVFVIAAGETALFNRLVLASRPMVWVGRISYPLYLWHWPLLSFTYYLYGFQGKVPTSALVTAVVLSFLLAWLTYRFVEVPIRFHAVNRNRASACFATMAVLGCAGLAIFLADGLPFRTRSIEQALSSEGAWQHPGNLKDSWIGGNRFFTQDTSSKAITMYIGDSNMEQYYPRIDDIIEKNKNLNSIIFATSGGCIPIEDVTALNDAWKICEGYTKQSYDMALSNDRVDTVVIAAAWDWYFAAILPRWYRDHGTTLPIDRDTEGYKKALANLANLIHELRHKGKRVYIILSIPSGAHLDPKSIVYRSLARFPSPLSLGSGGISEMDNSVKYGFIAEDLARVARSSGAITIDPVEHVCSEGWCPVRSAAGETIYKDSFHLNANWVRRHAAFIDRTAEPIQARDAE